MWLDQQVKKREASDRFRRVAIFKMHLQDKSKFINAAYLSPATIVFSLYSIKIFSGILSHLDNLNKFEEMGTSLIILVVLFLCGMLAIAELWYLILFPAKVESLSETKKYIFNIIIFWGVIICSLNFFVLTGDVLSSFQYGYPPPDQTVRSAIYAVCSLGPLRLVSRAYFKWSFQRFCLVILFATIIPRFTMHHIVKIMMHRQDG